MKSKKLFFCFLPSILTLLLIIGIVSCKSSGEVISLLDSYGVGDVPGYPGADYDRELNEQLGEFKNQLNIPDEYSDVSYAVVVANDSSADVLDHYNNVMQKLDWKKTLDLTSDEGGFMVWEKVSNRNSIISYIILTGKIQYGNRNEVVLLTGVIIPDRGSEDDKYTETTEEGSEIGAGSIYFENSAPPEGQRLLQTKPVSMAIDEWNLWLQEGSKTKGTNKVYLTEDTVFDDVVEFYRASDPADGGAAGIYQDLDIDLSKFSRINIWIVGKVLNEKGGSIASVSSDGFFPEGAVQVRIKYLTEDNTEKEWFHGFFYSNITYYNRLHFSLGSGI